MAPVTYAGTRRSLIRGEITCKEVVSSFLEVVAERDGHLNAFTQVDADGALRRAEELDGMRAAGQVLPPLAGLVLAVKDVICVRGWKVTCASRMLSNFTSVIDATAVRRLVEAGAIILGKTNCDEFAMGSSNESSYFGPVRHPRCAGYVPGGSSGGSAAAVASGMCHAALGTDTGGSIRQPAAFCGVVGLKPTYGRVSRFGLVAHASSLDCIGPMAHTVEDARMVLAAMAGKDPKDATSADVPVRAHRGGSIENLSIGLPAQYFGNGLDAAVRSRIEEVAERLREAGASVRTVDMPHTGYGVATYYILATAEASSNLGRYDGVRYGYRPDKHGTAGVESMYVAARSLGFGEEVRRRIMLGTFVLSSGYYEAYYGKAQRVRSLIRRDFDRAFRDVDVLVTPAAPVAGFRMGSLVQDPLQMYLSDLYTVTANLAGIPGLVVPIGTHPEGLPIGMQLLGRPFEEMHLLEAGRAAAEAARR